MVRHHPLKSACESFAFQRCLFHGSRDGLGSFPIASFLTQMSGAVFMPRPRPRAGGQGVVSIALP